MALKIIKEFEASIPDLLLLNKLSIARILENPQDFIDDYAKLRIHEIKMASPGYFSLQGVGEPIKHCLQFINNLIDRIPTKKNKLETEIIRTELEKKS